jgi:hypothetical protein
MSGAIPPLPQYAFVAWCLVKAQGTGAVELPEFVSRGFTSSSVSIICGEYVTEYKRTMMKAVSLEKYVGRGVCSTTSLVEKMMTTNTRRI